MIWATPRQADALTVRDVRCLFFVCDEAVSSLVGCDDEWGCGSHSPFVDGAAIEQPAIQPVSGLVRRPARVRSILREFACWLFDVFWEPAATPIGRAYCDDDWGCGANSPVIDCAE